VTSSIEIEMGIIARKEKAMGVTDNLLPRLLKQRLTQNQQRWT
jgi:hypothetical protein